MMEYTINQLEIWDNKIYEIVKDEGLECYEQEFEICSYEDMLCYEAYVGMPSHYPHWSYGKAYERKKMLYSYNLEGLPYEMVINSNPCIAYLMRDNTLLLQILTMAHVYGHNDFFKNNRLFVENTNADDTIEMFKRHATRIRSYIEDPSIGYEGVENILDAAHALKYNTARLEQINEEEDVLEFIIKNGNLENWEKDIANIVKEEMKYFIPQIETKIMNEGWASYWHYKILNKLNLPQGLHFEFLNRHNQVIRPFLSNVNPYYVGFKMFEDIEKKYGIQKIFEVRKLERDQSFIRRYLTEELCREMNLFTFSKKYNTYEIDDISDESGWKEIRNTLASNVGLGSLPHIKVVEIMKDRSLVVEHEYDNRELELRYAYETLKYLSNLWGNKVMLRTNLNKSPKVIICDENKKISVDSSK